MKRLKRIGKGVLAAILLSIPAILGIILIGATIGSGIASAVLTYQYLIG